VGDPVVHNCSTASAATSAWCTWTSARGTPTAPRLQEFLHLEYADGDVLYVPVSAAAPDQPLQRRARRRPAPLHKLGSGQWEKAKKKAAEQVRDAAAELLATSTPAALGAPGPHLPLLRQHDYGRLRRRTSASRKPPTSAMPSSAVIQRHDRPRRPMDRLVCGDVGFGKTEVALRAAFVAVAGGKQVAVLAPTTLLAEQHYQTFTDRFAQVAEWPARIAEMSASRAPRKSDAAAEGSLAEGKVDVAGRHAPLLQRRT
jgi:transcription-repair coupling factor (superfamily II helicase)